MSKTISHKRVDKKHNIGTGYRGTVKATFAQLGETFGTPDDVRANSDGKVRWQWTLSVTADSRTCFITIYDWKEPLDFGSEKNENVLYEWHIGGNTGYAEEYVARMIEEAK